jgi:hypothetical protein
MTTGCSRDAIHENSTGDGEFVAALAGWAAALADGDRPAALAAAERALELARSANSPYLVVAEACVEHAGGAAAVPSHEAIPCSCSFCGATQDGTRLIGGPDVFVCETCIGSDSQPEARHGAGEATGRSWSFCNAPANESASAVGGGPSTRSARRASASVIAC